MQPEQDSRMVKPHLTNLILPSLLQLRKDGSKSMPVYKESRSGKTSYRIDLNFTDQNGKRRHICRRGFAKKKDAEAEEARIRNSFHDELPSSLTLDDLVEQYTENYRLEGVKESTLVSNLTIYKCHIAPVLGSKRVKDITVSMITKWMTGFLNKEKPDGSHYAANTVNNAKMVLSKYLTYAVKLELIASNPAQKVKKFQDTQIVDQEVETNVWTEEEWARFISFVEDQNWKDVFIFLWSTGVRRGELIALRWNNIDFDQSKIRIEATATNKTKSPGQIRTAPKTKRSVRTIDMPETLREVLLERYKREMHMDGFSSKYYVFGDIRPLSPTTLKRKHDEYMELAGVKRITLHGFRHSHASILIMHGLPDQMIADRLGHTIEILHKVYAHIYDNQRNVFKAELNTIYKNYTQTTRKANFLN